MSQQQAEQSSGPPPERRRRTKYRKKTPAQRAAERAKREAERALIGRYTNDNQVLSFFQWCLLNGFSRATGRRILASGTGPTVLALGKRRIGIRVLDNRRWQESRARGAA
jgi:hypothetical protein